MERSQQHLQNTASFQQSLAPKGNDYLINTRKRGRKRLSDQEFRVVDEKEADEIRKRNNQTLQEMMSGSQKQKKDSAKQPNNLPLTYYPQQQIVHQTAINYEAQFIRDQMQGIEKITFIIHIFQEIKYIKSLISIILVSLYYYYLLNILCLFNDFDLGSCQECKLCFP